MEDNFTRLEQQVKTMLTRLSAACQDCEVKLLPLQQRSLPSLATFSIPSFFDFLL